MPARKQPKTLQAFSLETIGDNVFKKTVIRVTEEAVSRHLQYTPNQISFKDRSRSVRVSNQILLEHAIEQLQNCLLEGTAHYFHAKIINECLVSGHSGHMRSDICKQQQPVFSTLPFCKNY